MHRVVMHKEVLAIKGVYTLVLVTMEQDHGVEGRGKTFQCEQSPKWQVLWKIILNCTAGEHEDVGAEPQLWLVLIVSS